MKTKSIIALLLACLFTSGCSLMAELNAEPEKEPEAKLAIFGEITEKYYTNAVEYTGIAQNVGDATGKVNSVTITLFKDDVKVTSQRGIIAGGANLLPGEKGAFEITFFLDDPRNDFDRCGVSFECFTVK